MFAKEISSPLGETYDIIPFIDRAEKEMILLAGEFMEISSSLETYQKMHEYFSGERHLRYPILEEKASLILPWMVCSTESGRFLMIKAIYGIRHL